MTDDSAHSTGGSGLRWILLLVVAAGAAAWMASRPSTARHGLSPNAKLSAIDLTPLVPADAPRPTLETLRGKVVVVNFWATWCGPCIQEFPHLVDLVRGYRGRDDFRFLSVAIGEDQSELRSDVAEFLSAGGYDLPVVADLHRRTTDALRDVISADAIPLTLLIDRDGTITDAWIGYTPRGIEELKLRTAALLGN